MCKKATASSGKNVNPILQNSCLEIWFSMASMTFNTIFPWTNSVLARWYTTAFADPFPLWDATVCRIPRTANSETNAYDTSWSESWQYTPAVSELLISLKCTWFSLWFSGCYQPSVQQKHGEMIYVGTGALAMGLVVRSFLVTKTCELSNIYYSPKAFWKESDAVKIS